MENVKDFSIFGAFTALRDMDEEVEIKVKGKKLDEGSSFPVNDIDAMKQASEIRNQKAKEDVDIEIVDANAADDEHVLNNSSYIGDKVIKCNACHNTRVVSPDLIEKQEDGSFVIKEDGTNSSVRNECPHCHKDDTTYKLVGDIAASHEEEEQPKFENDEADSNEAKFDNDFNEEQPAEPEEAAEPETNNNSDDWGGFEKYDAADDLDYTDTDAPDDTEDVKDTTGDEFDVDDELKAEEDEAANFEEDDEKKKRESLTEDIPLDEEDNQEEEELPDELPELPEDEGTEEVGSDTEEGTEEPQEEVSEPEEEVIPERVDSFYTVGELLNTKFILPEEIKEIIIYDMDLDKELFKGKLSEMSKVFKDATCAAFEVTGKNIIANISVDGSEGNTQLSSALEDFRGDGITVTIYDRTTDMELGSGKCEDMIGKFGKFNFVGYEIPGTVKIIMRSDAAEAEPVKESLIEKIVKLNNGKLENLNKYGTFEYWINEEFETKEDLDTFVESYMGNSSEDLMKEFCEATGYIANKAEAVARQELVEKNCYGVVYGFTRGKHSEELLEHIYVKDEEHLERVIESIEYKENAKANYVVTEDTHAREAQPEVDLISIHNDRCKMACAYGKPVIYGYMGSDHHGGNRYFEIDPIVCDDLKAETEKVTSKYNPTGSILVAYPDECESIQCVDRHELAEKVNELKNNNKPYSVRRSMVEGYRWTVISPKTLTEAKKEEELPVDKEAVKTEVHGTLADLITDEIEAIQGYEEAKANIQDSPIEHKDEIIDGIDHIEDEEKEHVDELVEIAKEIPFEKEDTEEDEEEPVEVPEEPVSEPTVPEEVPEGPQEVPEVPEEVSEAVETEDSQDDD